MHSWYFQIIPEINTKTYGLVGCKSIQLRTLKSFFAPDQSNIAPAFRTGEVEYPHMIYGWGDCAIS